jgi:hypothetical protein
MSLFDVEIELAIRVDANNRGRHADLATTSNEKRREGICVKMYKESI